MPKMDRETYEMELHRECDPSTYHYGIWFADAIVEGEAKADVLIKVYRALDNELEWTVVSRTRTILDNKIWDSEDKKSFRRTFFQGTEEQMAAWVQGQNVKLAERMIQEYGGTVDPMVFDHLPTRCTGDKLGEIFASANRPWLHAKTIAIGKAVAEQKSPMAVNEQPWPISDERLDEILEKCRGIEEVLRKAAEEKVTKSTMFRRLTMFLVDKLGPALKKEEAVFMLCVSMAKKTMMDLEERLGRKNTGCPPGMVEAIAKAMGVDPKEIHVEELHSAEEFKQKVAEMMDESNEPPKRFTP